jgi:pimeloyl-ACP methyl ester carboxylesterase
VVGEHYPRSGFVRANGIRYAYLEEGSGPLVLLLHGYPDSAHTWEHQMPALAAAGHRVVAPFMRGYPPTEIPAGGYYDRATLAMDVRALIEELGGGEPIDLVGQDWGAAIGYGVLGAFPELVRRAVILAVPHPLQVKRTLRRSPKHVIRSFHWFLFQLPWLPERLIRARDHAFIEFLWWLWSPAYDDRAHVADIKRMMAQPGAVEATLGYYRAMIRADRQDPALGEVRARLDRPISVPTRVLCGSRDMRKQMLEGQRDCFAGGYDWAIVDGAGHFLHRERPDEVNRLILEWLHMRATEACCPSPRASPTV